MFHKIKTVVPLKNYILCVTFVEGCTKKYDVKPLFEEIKVFNNLKDLKLFNKVKVGHDGYAVVWNNDLDLACDELFNKGALVKTPFDNLIAFSDATKFWGLNESTLRKAIQYKKLVAGVDASKFGKQWVVSTSAMIREYGDPEVNIEIKKNINSFLIMSIEQYSSFINKSSDLVYKEMLDKGVIEEIKKDYEDLHSMSPEYLNEYYSALLKTPINSKINKSAKMDTNLLNKILIITKVTELISQNYSISLDEARNLLYKSKTLKKIKDDETGLYSQSPLYCFSLFEQEHNKQIELNKKRN